MVKEVINYNKRESFIRVGHNGTKISAGNYTCSDLANFPTPSSLSYTLSDLDKDAYTDLKGYTHRNRVRHDVVSLEFTYNILSDDDLEYILDRISPSWIYVEIYDKKSRARKVYKMYASDKKFDTFKAWSETVSGSTVWKEEYVALSFTLVQE